MNSIEAELITKGENDMIGKYVIVRGYRAGVFAGTLEKIEGEQVVLTNARRLWRWEGSASLSQMAKFGTSKPNECQFPTEVSKVYILKAFEIIECSEIGEKSIKEVPIWSK